MFDRRFFAEGAAIVVIAVLCATISNFAAARERKVAWVGDYPRALQVPAKPAAEPLEATVPLSAPSTDSTQGTAPADPAATAAVDTASTASAPAAATAPQAPASRAASPAQNAATATAPAPAKPKKLFPPHPDKPFVEISNEDAMQLWHEKAIFIDARRTDIYAAGHIAGARSMPVWEADINDRVRAFFDEVADQQQPIVIYCSGGNCEDSHMLAEKLWGAGYENVLVYKDGFPAWQKMGGAVR